ncbi:MAG TPA: methionine ABC transporter permease [Myxococcota bacterium]|nr:methionine ABC transporter permease [Myxococcota bacterium]
MSLEPLLKATWETVYMVAVSGACAALLGIPLGFLLFIFGPRTIYGRPTIYQPLALMVNTARSIPFIILLVALIPFTRFVIGTSIGTTAALVPLTLSAVPFLARLTEGSLLAIPYGLIEAAMAMGATRTQLLYRVLWPESLASIINGITVTTVNLVGYSAMAGAIGGGGLGDLAIRYGYQRFDISVMLLTIAVLIVLVQGLQSMGEMCSRMVKRGQ